MTGGDGLLDSTASFADAQVIIIENSKQLPSDEELGGVNVLQFTGNDQARHGFIP